MSRRPILTGFALIAAILGWYFFRPERAFINRSVTEPLPQSETAEIVLQGTFHSNAHDTRGAATVHRLSDGRLVLRFTDFETSNGPDVQIYLVAASDVNHESDAKQGFINLGAMKGNIGDQNYDIPAGTDLSRYRAVSVWCQRFAVNFGAAPLAPPRRS
ncbi:MAG TPA: DM13 domain-containing protein [Gemmatimonadales bacterium]|jgi:hypothetical protein